MGPQSRPGDIILTILNILRNLSVTADNLEHLSKHDRLVSVLLRTCMLRSVAPGSQPTPASPALSLSDLVAVRKDTVQILINIGPHTLLSRSDSSSRNARRAFELLVSYFTDPGEAVPPYQCLIQTMGGGQPTHATHKPPSAADCALEAFTRICQPDDNRQLFSKAVPQEWLWTVFEALVHRLPIADNDYSLLTREAWMAYFERVIQAIYSLAFLSPPNVKTRVKTDRRLRFNKVMLRIFRKLTQLPSDLRQHFMVSVKRGIEATKLIDDAEDTFDTSHSTLPTLSFGMGYGEHGETRVEKGFGLFGGYQEDITWGVMMQREIDDSMFAELTSLTRVA